MASEVLSALWSNVCVQLHSDTTKCFAVSCHVEENLWVASGSFLRLVCSICRSSSGSSSGASELAGVDDRDRLEWLVVTVGSYFLDLHHDVQTLGDFAEHNVLAVEERGLHRRDEELGSVGAGASIGHREQPRLVVLQLEVLVLEFSAVNRLATRAIAGSEVATLEHKVWNHPVEGTALVAQLLALLAAALLSGAQRPEVLSSLWDHIGEEFELNALGLAIH